MIKRQTGMSPGEIVSTLRLRGMIRHRRGANPNMVKRQMGMSPGKTISTLRRGAGPNRIKQMGWLPNPRRRLQKAAPAGNT